MGSRSESSYVQEKKNTFLIPESRNEVLSKGHVMRTYGKRDKQSVSTNRSIDNNYKVDILKIRSTSWLIPFFQ